MPLPITHCQIDVVSDAAGLYFLHGERREAARLTAWRSQRCSLGKLHPAIVLCHDTTFLTSGCSTKNNDCAGPARVAHATRGHGFHQIIQKSQMPDSRTITCTLLSVRCCCVRVFVLCVRVCDYGCAGSCTVVMGRTTASKLKQTCCYRLGRDVWEMSQGVWIAASPMRLETLALCALNSASPVAWKCIIYSLSVCLPCLRSHVLVPVATVVLCTSVLGGRYRVLRPSISKRCPGPDRPVQRCGRGM